MICHSILRAQEIEAALKSHDYASAEAALVQVADQHPKVPQIYDFLGRIFFVDGKYLNAAIALKKAEALQPLEEKIDSLWPWPIYLLSARPGLGPS